jgi:hypothetical protein
MLAGTRWAQGVAMTVLIAALSVSAALAQPSGMQVRGIVDQVDGQTLWLEDGTNVPLSEQTRVTQMWTASFSDLQPGMFVAISARRLVDGSLLASLVTVAPAGARSNTSQRELTDFRFCEPGCEPGDLMTNAEITSGELQDIQGNGFTVNFENTQVLVTYDTRIYFQGPGSMEDVVPGAEVIGFVNAEGVATSLWVPVQ